MGSNPILAATGAPLGAGPRQPARRGRGLPRGGARARCPAAALGHLVRRARPSVTGRLPRGVSGKQAVAALEHTGFIPVRLKGDHQILRHPNPDLAPTRPSRCRCTASWPAGTLAGILRRIGMTAAEFTELLRPAVDCRAEAWPSGRRHTPGKRVGGSRSLEGSNPSASATKSGHPPAVSLRACASR